MSLVCNVKTEEARLTSGDWEVIYRENEKFIESGSAYFSQAFAEALGIVSDIELHDLQRAQLRVRAIDSLLRCAMDQYETSVEFDSRTGLADYHERRLREIGLDRAGTAAAIEGGRERGHLEVGDGFAADFASIYGESGYQGLTETYLTRVRKIVSLVKSSDAGIDDWQGFGWKLTSAFADAMIFGQAIAILNGTAYRS